ncbi:MAG: glycerophosphodiester phosphodiesterase [Dorea sp.]|jgi:glycerophosphoryl diester phosphodiesterase|nr:glycerophosphodiester phosphodiesterase [Dorea sp.]
MWIAVTCLLFITLYLFLLLPRRSGKRRMNRYKHTLFAHRGYHCIEKGIPENSMKAFQAAVKNDYGIELDVHLTRDGNLVVFHDDTLNRVCGCPGSVEGMTLEQLKRCRLLGTSERIPLFSEVLSLVDGKVPLLIELKIPSHSLKVCGKTYELLKDYRGDYLIQSFNTLGICWFRLHAPEVLRGQLSSRLTRTSSKEPWILKFFTEHLLCNILGRPDFISYKLADLPQPEVGLLRRLFHVPLAVWTLRTRAALKEGILHYDMQIFEKDCENY